MRIWGAMVFVVGVTSVFGGADAARGSTFEWSDYSLGQYVASRGRPPGTVLKLDNNGEILLACRNGCTLQSLEAVGVTALASQLELLSAWSLLVREGDGFRSGVPILDGENATYLDELAIRVSEQVAQAADEELAALLTTLNEQGWQGHAWSVVFSYVLDGMVWQFLDELDYIDSRLVLENGASWGGEIWAYSGPERPTTASRGFRGVTIKVTSVESNQSFVASALSGPRSLAAMLAVGNGGGPEAAELVAHYQELGVLGPERELMVPVIDEQSRDEIFRLCEQLAGRVVDAVHTRLDRSALMNDFGFTSPSQALIVSYHSVMRRLMDLLVERGTLSLPAAIADYEGSERSDLGKLILLVRQPTPTAPTTEDTTPERDEG